MTWTSSFTGEVVGELALVANLADPDPTIRFVHSTGRGVIVDYLVDLTSTGQRLGGVRWWFLCPMTGARVGTLVLPRGAARFGSRAAYRLDYQSQRSSDRDRAIAKMHRLKRRLGAEPSDMGLIDKPPGMHRTTFERKLADLRAAENSAYGYLRCSVEALHRRFA